MLKMFIIFLKINIKIYYVKMTILEVLKNTMNVIRSRLNNTNKIKLLYQLNNQNFNPSVILPMENSMPGNVLESVIADILITYYTDQDNGYWSHQKNRESIDLIYHSNNLKKNKKCEDKVSEILLEVKSAVKNFNAKPSNEYSKFKSKFKHAFILYILYEIDDLKSILQLNKYNIKIYNYSKMVRKNKISDNKTKALVENNKRLYESIMKDVAKTVKKHLNENVNIDDILTDIETITPSIKYVKLINNFTEKIQKIFNVYNRIKLLKRQQKYLLSSSQEDSRFALYIQLYDKKSEEFVLQDNLGYEFYFDYSTNTKELTYLDKPENNLLAKILTYMDEQDDNSLELQFIFSPYGGSDIDYGFVEYINNIISNNITVHNNLNNLLNDKIIVNEYYIFVNDMDIKDILNTCLIIFKEYVNEYKLNILSIDEN